MAGEVEVEGRIVWVPLYSAVVYMTVRRVYCVHVLRGPQSPSTYPYPVCTAYLPTYFVRRRYLTHLGIYLTCPLHYACTATCSCQ